MQKERCRESPLMVRYPNCADIDVGKKEHHVVVSEEAADENVQGMVPIRRRYWSCQIDSVLVV